MLPNYIRVLTSLPFIILLTHFPSLLLAQDAKPLITTKYLIPKNGATTPSLLSQWELSFTTSSYLPICGLSTELEGVDYWSNSLECEPAMSTWNATTSTTQAGFYTLQGAAIPFADVKIGDKSDGLMKCLCFGVRHTTGTGLGVCLLVGGKGEIFERKASYTGTVAVGLQVPESDEKKILLTCQEYAIKNPSPSSTAGSNSGSASGTSSSTTAGVGGVTDGSVVASDTPTNPTTAANQNEKKPFSLSTENIIGIAVGLPGAIVAIITLIMLIRQRRKKKADNHEYQNPPAQQQQQYHQGWAPWSHEKVTVAPGAYHVGGRPAELGYNGNSYRQPAELGYDMNGYRRAELS